MPKGVKPFIHHKIRSANCTLCEYRCANFKDDAYQVKILSMHLLKVHGIETPKTRHYSIKIDPESHSLTPSQKREKYT